MKKQDSAVDLNRQLDAYAAVGRLPECNPRGRWGKWPIYAVATGAALAGASAASADIFYSGPLNLSGRSFNISPDGKHLFDFYVNTGIRRHFVSSTTYFGRHSPSANLEQVFAGVGAGGTGPRLGEGVFATGTLAKNFAFGAPIGPGTGTQLDTSRGRWLGTVHSVVTHQGQFINSNGPRGNFANPGFLGIDMFQRTSKGGIKPGSEEFGWIKVEFNSTYPASIDVLGYAYNTDGPITAGETGSVVPEPSFLPLMLLAGGAAGVLAWKKHRSRQAPND
jgi:PEP-CTERM motif